MVAIHWNKYILNVISICICFFMLGCKNVLSIDALVSAPEEINYATDKPTYTANVAIPNNQPIVKKGGTPTLFTVSPPLPPGIKINKFTGVISGTPIGSTPKQMYKVKASNARGSLEVDVELEVITGATISISDEAVTEGSAATFTLTLSQTSTQNISVDWTTEDVSALDGVNYTADSGTATVLAGNLTTTISVNTTDLASICAPDTVFRVRLSNAVNAGIADILGLATIADDDLPQISINEGADVTEGVTAAPTVSITPVCNTKAVSVEVSTGGGDASAGFDYTALSSQVVTITAGNTSSVVNVATNDDGFDEAASQSFNLTLANPTNATINDGTATQNILDNDSPPNISIANVTVDEGDVATMTVTIDAISELNVGFHYSTADGTATVGDGDYTGVPSTGGTITAGNTTTTFNVTTLEDVSNCEATENLTVNLASITNSTVATPGDDDATITITDDDFPSLSISEETDTEGATLTFTATLSLSCPSASMSFDYYTISSSASTGDDYTSASGTVTIPATQTTATFNVTTLQDTVSELSEEFLIGVSNPVNIVDISNGFSKGIINDDEVGEATAKIVAGGLHKTCAMSTAGNAKCWGSVRYNTGTTAAQSARGNGVGEMGDNLPTIDLGTHDALGITPHTILKASTMKYNGCALLDTNQLKCWGENNTGTAGTEGTFDKGYWDHKVGDDPDEMGDNLPYTNLGTHDALGAITHTVSDFALSLSGACAILDDGRIKCWGSGGGNSAMFGQGTSQIVIGNEANEMGDNLPYIDLGTHDALGVTPHTAKSVAMSSNNVCVILDDDRVKCWGGQEYKHGLGGGGARGDNPNEMGDNLPYVDLGTHDALGITPHTAQSLSNSPFGFCAILDDARLKCWGTNTHYRISPLLTATDIVGDAPGEMGDNLPYIDLGTHDGLGITSHTVKKLATTSYRHTCAILDDDRLKCWGYMKDGALGLGVDSYNQFWGDTPAEMGDGLPYVDLGTGRTAKDVLVHGYSTTLHTIVIRDDNTAVSFGTGGSGQLGYENTTDIGTTPAHMGDNLVPIDLGTGLTAKAVAETDDHYDSSFSCLVLSNDQMKCWGQRTVGYYDGTSETDGGVGDQPGEMGVSLSNLTLANPAVDITAWEGTNTNEATCIKMNNEELTCWGRGRVSGGTLAGGLGILKYQADDDACAIDENFDLRCWVTNGMSTATTIDFGAGLKVLAFTKSSFNTDHKCVLLSDKTVRCWGNNWHGQLGIETGSNVNTPGPGLTPAMLGSVSEPIDVQATYRGTCVHFANGGVKCWGQWDDLTGQANNGATQTGERMGDDVGEMGDNLNFIDFGTGRTVKKLFVGTRGSACAKLDNDNTVCWGSNGYGRLGTESTASIGNGIGSMGNSLVPLDLNGGVVDQMSINEEHVCAVQTNGDAKCWGDNRHGQLGQEDQTNRGHTAGTMGVNLDPIDLVW